MRNVFISFPFHSRQVGNYRNAQIIAKDNRLDDYIENLVVEINRTLKWKEASNRNTKKQQIESLYISGGDTNLLTEKHLSKIMIALESHLEMTENTEFTVRVSPNSFSKEKLDNFTRFGVNRVSLAIPSFAKESLKSLQEDFSVKKAMEACDIVRGSDKIKERSIHSFYGIPNQTMEQLEESMDTLLKMDTTHVTMTRMNPESFYFWSQRDYEQEALAIKMYQFISQKLVEEAWEHYDVRNLAKTPESCCLHKISFRQNKPFYGFGMGATSLLEDIRVTRPFEWAHYKEFVESLEEPQSMNQQGFDEKPIFNQFMIKLAHGLRCKMGFNLAEFKTKVNPEAYDNAFEYLSLLVNFSLLESNEKDVFYSLVPCGYLNIAESTKIVQKGLEEYLIH